MRNAPPSNRASLREPLLQQPPIEPLSLILNRLDRRLLLVDVGARWGPAAVWNAVSAYGDVVCFEPDPQEAQRLAASAPPHVQYVCAALGAVDGSKLEITITREPACSSVYPPIRTLFTDYPALDCIAPESRASFPARTLDAALAEIVGERRLDWIKLDTQGSELDILRGGERALSGCSLIDVEVEFNPIYEGQNLFCDVDRFLRDHGFVLWRLSELVHYAPEAVPTDLPLRLAFTPGTFHDVRVDPGQLFWANAQYVRADLPRTGARALSPTRGLAAAAVTGLAGLWDLTLEILRKCDAELAASVRAHLTQPSQPS